MNPLATSMAVTANQRPVSIDAVMTSTASDASATSNASNWGTAAGKDVDIFRVSSPSEL